MYCLLCISVHGFAPHTSYSHSHPYGVYAYMHAYIHACIHAYIHVICIHNCQIVEGHEGCITALVAWREYVISASHQYSPDERTLQVRTHSIQPQTGCMIATIEKRARYCGSNAAYQDKCSYPMWCSKMTPFLICSATTPCLNT
jgi:hypothetical protein